MAASRFLFLSPFTVHSIKQTLMEPMMASKVGIADLTAIEAAMEATHDWLREVEEDGRKEEYSAKQRSLEQVCVFCFSSPDVAFFAHICFADLQPDHRQGVPRRIGRSDPRRRTPALNRSPSVFSRDS
jgi:hypothetical protein